ncbi:polysaccharide biosynthesis tyrosine autokinase [Rubrivirga sp. IMCC45206]|uniref:polysaccharide biosynthesis tyrosine autokinase n=1 Tax=Rubrivirga sp. IMCC45206 TaxID=3391614 RepID=UPI00398F9630
MPTPTPFPPETFGPPAQAPDYSRAGYGYGPPSRPPTDFAAQIREWTDVVARGRWLILAAVLAVMIPVGLYLLLAPDVYEASTQLYVETESGGPLSGLLPGGGDVGGGRGISDELYILQNAEDLAEATAARLIAEAEMPDATAFSVLETESGEIPSVKVVAARITGSYLQIRQDGSGANGVRLSARSQIPEEAAMIANLYAKAYVDRTQNSSRASVSASREFLEAQADSVATELAARENAALTYMDEQDAVRLDDEAANIVSQLAALEAARDQARVEAGMESSRITELRSQIAQLEGTVAQRMGSGTDRALRADEERLGALKGQLEAIYLRDPALRDQADVPADVATLRSQIARVEARVRQQSGQLVEESIAAGGVDAATEGLPRLSALRDRLTAAEVSLRGYRSRVDILNGRISSYRSELDRIPGQTVALARLVREQQSAERLALGLDQKLQEARVAESAELGYAEVVRTAGVPDTPVAPNRPRLAILGLLIGLGLGLVLAVGRSQLDQAIRRPSQLRELGHPLLGVIPDMTRLIEEDHEGAAAMGIKGWEVDSRIVTIINPMSTAAEAFRGLRTSIQFSRPDAPVQTILVTSASPGEGKSTVAANLAVVMAQAGRRTLLVDADLRRPRVDKLFGMARSPGLSDYISGNADERDLTVADDFDVLPAGTTIPSPAEHLGSRAFRDLLETFKGAYDLVIIDAPPVLAATDPVLLSTQTDAVVVVATAGKTKDFELNYAVEEVQAVGGQVIGVILNRFDVTQEYGYRYQYSYKYGNKYTYGADEA